MRSLPELAIALRSTSAGLPPKPPSLPPQRRSVSRTLRTACGCASALGTRPGPATDALFRSGSMVGKFRSPTFASSSRPWLSRGGYPQLLMHRGKTERRDFGYWSRPFDRHYARQGAHEPAVFALDLLHLPGRFVPLQLGPALAHPLQGDRRRHLHEKGHIRLSGGPVR